MPLTVKRHKRKKVIGHKNKKRIRKQRSKLPKIQIPHMSQVWDDHKSAKRNLSEMGLCYDPNISTRSSSKKACRKEASEQKSNIATALEAEAKAPRVVKFKFPKTLSIYYSYLISKYGDNYKEMAKDPKNVYQDTWKKIRSRIMQFKKLESYKTVINNM